MEELALVSLFVLLVAAAATPEQPPFGIRSVTPTPSIGAFNEKPFLDKLGDIPGRDVVIFGVQSMNISFYSLDYHDAVTGGVQFIHVTYTLSNGSLYTPPRHGGISCFGCRNVSITLSSYEFIEKVTGATDGVKINQMTIHTRNARLHERKVYGPFGNAGVETFLFEGRVFGFFGNYGYYLNGIGALTLSLVKQSLYFGSGKGVDAGNAFDDNPDFLFSAPVAKIMKIHIYFSNMVNAFQAEYLLFDGRITAGPLHGKTKGESMSTVTLDPSEVLAGIEGTLSDDGNHIVEISFVTWKRDGNCGRYGPYGGSAGNRSISSYGYRIMGFFGTVAESLNGIGVYYQIYP
jgi:hypothetical protein